MLSKLKKSNNEGFTIIEVMIVLAIAGLILLIVFLAIPALQRNARNTQRKNDASQVAAAVANYIENNGGTNPGAVGNDASTANTVDICGASCAAGNKETAKLGYYQENATTQSVVVKADGSTLPSGAEQIVIQAGYTCNGTNTGIGSASSRTDAILYDTESGSGQSTQCVEQ